jgi:hypothetical protein
LAHFFHKKSFVKVEQDIYLLIYFLVVSSSDGNFTQKKTSVPVCTLLFSGTMRQVPLGRIQMIFFLPATTWTQ